ncbi:MAG: methylated-DNA--[protein]-cysteine S-methyltransferase [Reyranella sp.]|uniref:methylated-DNA--[protein]-cysteine S-methyltransferase n=1 Tax=Reyranella sp. TaxID=1929291 RepID=UPI0011F987A6|nr:methylated-DNA--[protein]-cysteine S-methyltransferase [Reyranella sp.]TAJ42572.1 MAG: methylated-DNA--[protein]-cysteine S-methyltransferase [Reyranella sp.]
MSTLGFTLFDSPIGTCGLAWSARGIAGLQLPEASAEATRKRLQRRWSDAVESDPPPGVGRAIERVLQLLKGEAADLADIPLDLEAAPEFHRKVYEVARTIPPGRTMTYGEIAKRLGVPHESREVGQALGRNPVAIIVPCHRVLGADGKMGGFSATGGVSTKRRMLEIEGAPEVGAGPLFAAR